MLTLNELFEKHKGIPKTFIDGMPAEWGGDKGSAHSYIETYEHLFSDIRYEDIKLLEIGVLYGSSVKMWRDYFENGIIYGMDVLESCKKYEEDRIKIAIADSTDPVGVEKNYAGLKFDIIIDDGHHDFDMQQKTFNTMFKYLKKGGAYIIEDIQDINRDRNEIMKFHKNVQIVDLRGVKNKYDDVLVVIVDD
jgi:hypothetical protein